MQKSHKTLEEHLTELYGYTFNQIPSMETVEIPWGKFGEAILPE